MAQPIKLYGAQRCHKTQYYQSFFKERGYTFDFLDVEVHPKFAEELRNLYTNRKLNFPTITIGTKKLRNPTADELQKWLDKRL